MPKKLFSITILIISLAFLLNSGEAFAAKNTTASLYKEAVSLNKKGKIYRASYKFSQFIDLADLNNDATNDMLITAAKVSAGSGAIMFIKMPTSIYNRLVKTGNIVTRAIEPFGGGEMETVLYKNAVNILNRLSKDSNSGVIYGIADIFK